MTDYNEINDSRVDEESPVTETLKKWLRDNPIAIAEGASGAPRYQNASLEDTPSSEAVTTNTIRDSAFTASKINNGEIDTGHFGSALLGKTVQDGDNHDHSGASGGLQVPYTAFAASNTIPQSKLSKHPYTVGQIPCPPGEVKVIENPGFYNLQCHPDYLITLCLYIHNVEEPGWFGQNSRIPVNTMVFSDGANVGLYNHSDETGYVYFQRDWPS
jgi:hypothetical protein